MKSVPLLFCVLLSTVFCGAVQTQDAQAIRTLEERFRNLRQQMTATQDPEAKAALQQKMTSFIEEAAANASEELRPVILLSLKITVPLQDQSAEYTRLVEHFHESNHGDPATLIQRSEIAERINELELLERKNAAFIDALSTINERLEQALVDGHISADLRATVLASHRKGASRSIPRMVTLRKLDAEAFALTKQLYRHLDENWGKWRVEQGEIQWTDAGAQEKSEGILLKLQQVTERATAAQS